MLLCNGESFMELKQRQLQLLIMEESIDTSLYMKE